MPKRHVLKYHTGSLTSGERKLLNKVRSHERYSPEQCVQIWYEVRTGEREKFPRGFPQKEEHRIAINRALVGQYRKEHPGGYPGGRYFRKNKLNGLLCRHYGGSPYAAFIEAGFADPTTAVYDSRLAEVPWTVIEKMPNRFWRKSRSNKKAAVRWTAETTGKPVTELKAKDFLNKGTASVLGFYDSIVAALQDADIKVDPFDMERVPRYTWQQPKNVRRAADDVSEQTGRPRGELRGTDFEENGYVRIATLYDKGELRKVLGTV